MSLIDAESFQRHLETSLPLCGALGLRAESVGEGRARVRLPFAPLLLRPGGIVSGPALMALADVAMYAAVMSIDERGAGATTLSLSTHFLRRTAAVDVIADAEVLSFDGERAVGRVIARAAGDDEPVAHFNCTYMFPSRRARSD